MRGLARQLWFGVDDDVRFAVTSSRRAAVAGFDTVEQYAVVPSARRPRVLLPTGPPAAARGSAVNYRALRGSRERGVRTALGLAASTRVPMALTRLHVLAPSNRPQAAASLPLHAIAAALDEGDLRASIGVRTSANRKATLQLVRTDGAPAGFAKIGWNASSDSSVRTESSALAALGPRDTGSVRVPRRLAALDYAGHPVVVTAPLPPSVRGIRPGRDRPTPVELRDLASHVRTDHVAAIGQVRSLRQRLGALALPSVAGPVEHARQLLAAVDADDPKLAVGARWHGDLTPWNTARDADGTLWAWDWESCEPDAPVGLDALHWAFSIHRDESGRGGLRLGAFQAEATQHLAALGVPRAAWPSLLRIYLATTIERVCRVAVEDGGWDRVWIQPRALTALTAEVDAAWSH